MKQVFIFIMTWTLNNNNSPWGSNPKGNEPNRGNGSFGGDDYFNSLQNKLKDMFPKNNPINFT